MNYNPKKGLKPGNTLLLAYESFIASNLRSSSIKLMKGGQNETNN